MKTFTSRFIFPSAIITACVVSMGHFFEMGGAYTGAPGEMTCVSCHTIDQTPTSGGAALEGLPSHVVAGQTYPLSMMIYTDNNFGMTAGFQMTFLNANGTAQGQLAGVDQDVSVREFGDRQYVQHEPGRHFFMGGIDDVMNYDFEWTPPDVGAPLDVFVWYNAMVGNGNYMGADATRGDTMFPGSVMTTVIPQLTGEIIVFATPLCHGDATGILEVSFSGGMAPVDILWSTGEMTTGIDGLPAGMYSVTLSDAIGQMVVLAHQLEEPELLMTDATIIDPSCVDGDDGSVLFSVSGGTPPFAFLWTGGNIPNPFTGLGADNYAFTITDVNGCSTEISVTITDPPGIEVELIDVEPQTPHTNGSIIIQVSGGTPPYDYFWEGPNDFNSTMQNPINLTAGVYHVTITDDNGCMHFFSAEVGFSSSTQDDDGKNGHLILAPNPGTARLHIVFPEGQGHDWEVHLIAPDGRIVLTDHLSGRDKVTYTVESTWTTGVYLVKVQDRHSGIMWAQRWIRMPG